MDVGNGLSCRSVMIAGCPPLVFKHAVDDWPAQQWTPEYLCQVLGNKLLDCKISLIQHEDFQWEPDCLHLKITMRQYVDWLQGGTDSDNPLRLFDKTKFSCYIDYKYMKDMFEEHQQILKSVSWSAFGLVDRGGEHSTIWIGSCGTYTPCHQDTYGFNLVAQIQGRKRWYLFNPDQTDDMYPTRIPYEESSVYSEVNVRYPDLGRHPLFQKTTPCIIELVPGDVLYVPRHWWHFVESLEPSISINTWVPMVEDAESHLEESVSRLLYTCLSTTLLSDIERSSYLNTGEELENNEVNLQYIERAVKDMINTGFTQGSYNKRQTLPAGMEKNQTDGQSDTVEHSCNNLLKLFNKFQDYIVTVACLNGVNIDQTEEHCGTNVRKRKFLSVDDENEGVKDKLTDIPSEMTNKQSKIESNETVPIEHEVATDGPSLPGVRVDSCTPSSQHTVLMEDSCKTNKSLIEIFAAKPFTFNEYLRFLEIVFDYELTSEENNCALSDLDKHIKSLKSSLTDESSTAFSSTKVTSSVPPFIVNPLFSSVSSSEVLTSTKSSSETALTSQTSSSLKTSPFLGTSSSSSSPSSSLRTKTLESKIATSSAILSTDTDNFPSVDLSIGNTNETVEENVEINRTDNEPVDRKAGVNKTDENEPVDRKAGVNQNDGDKGVVKMKQNVEKEEQRSRSDINDQNTRKKSDVSDDELNLDNIQISSADVINSILNPNVIRHIGHILLNKIKK